MKITHTEDRIYPTLGLLAEAGVEVDIPDHDTVADDITTIDEPAAEGSDRPAPRRGAGSKPTSDQEN